MTQAVAIASALPETGQIVEVRRRRYVVMDVRAGALPDDPIPTSNHAPQHLVRLSSVEDDGLREELAVVWKIEPGTIAPCEVRLGRRGSPAGVECQPHTGSVVSLNMEPGLLIAGGEVPDRVWAHLRRLIESGVLRRAGTGASAGSFGLGTTRGDHWSGSDGHS